MENRIASYTIAELAVGLRHDQFKITDLVEESLQSIERGNDLHAFISIFSKESRQAAKAQQSLLGNGYDLGPLQGIPIAVKDNIDDTQGATTYGSSIFGGHQVSQDALVVNRLKAAGAIIVGKTNLHEFAWGGTTSNPHYGVAKNPWDESRIPAGSSGGSGIAVAKRMVCAALGTDTGGSIRLPAAMDGVCGIRPTLGDLSIDGIFPVAWTMDTVGPLCSNAEDVEMLLAVMKGKLHSFTPVRPSNLTGLRIGIIKDYAITGLQAAVRTAFEDALALLQKHGAELVVLPLPGVEEVVNAQLVVDAVEPSAAHYQLMRDHADDYGADVLSRLRAGCDLTGVEYVQAQRFRLRFRQEMEQLFRQVDVVLTPTLPFTAPHIGATSVPISDGSTVSTLSGNMKYTAIPSMSGVPAMSIPIGFDQDGLPIGMQVIAPAHREDTALGLAKRYQQLSEFHKRLP
ncbi:MULTISPECIES: amidase [Bifidobacterium]|jgi:aspartyl-tRNA(Asn)/glutamyl-tRNA(Gln) amidotransferase subunit A|uniref:Amidase n=1 Tax=Bifidobacterium tibiigranuli TaxID=2172043 RepID=A0A5N6S2M4_9BIFI|nr:amidase [Bifidobacterium tibiigranuli]KAE8127374.1 amidase [Bifidobacterium tibiigranuli]KAE8129765.1 amidase [Bifidobacterium tibiigranuli]MCI1212278.1 amidase [Bifidobacterium tibiigranuli]MCI1221509.1 amidase [Bifidobacterium tibiigranuli]